MNFLRASSRTPRQNAISLPETPEDFVAKKRRQGKNIRLLQIVDTKEEIERLKKEFCPDNRNSAVVAGKKTEEIFKTWEEIGQIIQKKIQKLEALGQLENLTEKEKEDKVSQLILRKVKINILENGVIVETFTGYDLVKGFQSE
jgi:hypothetical protein